MRKQFLGITVDVSGVCEVAKRFAWWSHYLPHQFFDPFDYTATSKEVRLIDSTIGIALPSFILSSK